ncbi:MAG: cas1 [Acidimicrobiales bacterium]|nr:cas1 [Acidimicrobiales bacterium]
MTTLLAETFTDGPVRNGVRVVDGYGIRLAVERGHLVIADGTGRDRRSTRYPKVGHGLRRLVIIGHTGTISLEALRWLDRVGVPVVNIDNDGRELARTSRAGLDDARLRRIQALAAGTPTGLGIVVDLLDAKLTGQATLAADRLDAPDIAERIHALRDRLANVDTLEEARDCEAQGAYAYFSAWPDAVAIRWANRDRERVPERWHRFDARRSPLTAGSPVKAADPVNALLNYLYALAETECRLACQILGLDAGLGFLHSDTKGRDSLALDLIEPVRPHVDTYLLDLLDGHVFRKADFHESDDGHCRLLPPLTHRLADTLSQWQGVVAPWAESVAHVLADASTRPIRKPTPLTSATRRAAAIGTSSGRRKIAQTRRPATTPNVPVLSGCEECGRPLTNPDRRYCPDCWPTRRAQGQRAAVIAAAAASTDAAKQASKGSAISKAKLQAVDRAAVELGWQPDEWQHLIRPCVGALTLAQIQSATGYGISHASRIKRGVQRPHPRHWAALAAALTAPG